MTIQRVLHLNQNVSLHHRLFSSPFLCFFSSSSSCFFGLLQEEVFSFSIKKRERKRRAFFCVSRPLFSRPFRRLWKRQKKKRALFFLLLSNANKQTNANASLRLKSTTGGRVQKDDARLKKVLFLFCCVVLCSCFWSGCCFVSRGEREKGTTKKAQKRKEKILSVQKIRVPPRQKKLFFFFLFQKRAAKERRGLQKNILDRVENFYHSIIIGQFKFQLAS